jgi:hypothetical protein
MSQGLAPSTPATGPVPGMPEPGYDGPFGDGRGNAPGGGYQDLPMTPEMAAATIDPRYPDFILQAIQGRLRNRNNKWGPRPNGLGGY